MTRTLALLAVFTLSVLGACNDGSGSPDFAPRPPIDLSGQSEEDLATPAPMDLGSDLPPVLGCIENKSYCSAYNERSYCEDSATGPVWKKETCPTGCFAGACSTTACADECTLGVQSNLGLCKIWDLASNGWLTPDQSKLLDRAREHDRVTKEITKPALGAMVNPQYTDATQTTLAFFWGARDAAIWSGSYLASQAWRLLATGSRDAADEVATKTRMLHDWFKVTGDVGYVARFAAPRDASVPLQFNWQGQPWCTDVDTHCNVDFKNTKWDWIGGLSRDQYTGVMLGLMMAYLSSPDEEIRKLAREDVVTVVTELMKLRTIPVTVVIDNIPISTTVMLENVLIAPSEYQNGKVTINLETSSITSNDDTNIRGMREFLPDFSALVKQVIPFITIPIPRASTAMMLGGFFSIALRATKDVPGYESVRQQIQTYFTAHKQDWLTLASGWNYDGGCNPKYFANHIAYIMAYAWAALEEDPLDKMKIVDIVHANLWAGLKTHKNSYFAYLWAGTRSATPDPAVVDAANLQLAGFPVAPKGFPAIDHLAEYEQDGSCVVDGYATAKFAVDVKDRRMDDFIWQRGAWILKNGGDAARAFPATDYLAAYWVARRYALISDDHPGTCNRWAP